MSMGEARDMSGEAKSRSNIELPGVQEALIKAIHATGKPIVLLVNAEDHWCLNGVRKYSRHRIYVVVRFKAGNAIADVFRATITLPANYQ
jgi:beta-glucosidase